MVESGTPEYYRAKAKAVRETVDQLADITMRDNLRQIADDWDKMADGAEIKRAKISN